MIFCIDEDKHKKLSSLLSEALEELKKQSSLVAIAMNSYIVYKPLYDIFNEELQDGLNIRITIFTTEELVLSEKIKELQEKCREELNYNLEFKVLSETLLKDKPSALVGYLNDADILYDEFGYITYIQNSLLISEKSIEAVTYEPSLNLRGV